MKVLVTFATKHGATEGIAEHIAQYLRTKNFDARVTPADATDHVDQYEAVVIGSAVYYGSWLKEALEFVREHRAELSSRPVWLFSCGPLGTPVDDHERQPKEIGELLADTRAVDHRVFFGALDPHNLSFAERMVVKAVRAPTGDFRDWKAIEAWAADIAATLSARKTAQPTPLG